MSFIDLLDSNQSTVIQNVDNGIIIPGNEIVKRLGVKNNIGSPMGEFKVAVFPGLKNGTYNNTSGDAITGVDIIRADGSDNIKQIYKAKENHKTITKNTSRPVCLLYTSGNYTEIPSGEIPFLSGASDLFYVGLNQFYRRIYFDIETAGDYDTLAFKIFNGTDWVVPTNDDATVGMTGSGRIFLEIDRDDWARNKINNKKMLWLRFECAGCNTRAMFNNIYIQHLYNTPKALLGAYAKTAWDNYSPANIAKYYRWDKADEYIEKTSLIEAEYSYAGFVAFNDDPYDGASEDDYNILFEGSYKLPLIGNYTFTFTDATHVNVATPENTTSEFVIVNDGTTNNEIHGMNVRFSSLTAAGNTATVTISDAIEDVYLAKELDESNPDLTTLANSDLLLGDIDTDETLPFWLITRPSRVRDATGNTRQATFFFHGNDD